MGGQRRWIGHARYFSPFNDLLQRLGYVLPRILVFGDFISIAQSAGPAVILECYKTLGFEPLTEEINRLCPDTTPEYFEDTRPRPLLSGYLTNSITAALQSRDPGYAPYNQQKSILELDENVCDPCKIFYY